ncbi:hypothetical protein ACYSNO_04440 [Enterococcus sp. LJL98]
MSSTHFIREILDILDFNILFPKNEATEGLGIYSKEAYKGEVCHVFNGVFSYHPHACLKCGEHTRLLDILEERRKVRLESYF